MNDKETKQPISIGSLFEEKLENLHRIAATLPDDAGEYQDSGEHNKTTTIEKLKKANYPERHIAKLGKGNLMGPAYEKAKEMLPQIYNGDFLYILSGAWGTGKTQMAVFWAAMRAHKGKSCGTYTTLTSLMTAIKTTWDKANESENDVLRKFRTTKFLVIDEFQEQAGSDWESRILRSIIDSRYGAMLATIIIGNIPEADLPKFIWPSVIDRSTECGGLIFCNWGSYRKGNKQ
jgi:DNA replication protein DnaC